MSQGRFVGAGPGWKERLGSGEAAALLAALAGQLARIQEYGGQRLAVQNCSLFNHFDKFRRV